MKNKKYDDDDGRQIAAMDDVHVTLFGSGYMSRQRRSNISNPRIKKNTQPDYIKDVPLTKKEMRYLLLRTMLASLGIAMIFIAVAALFILFCIYVWFK